MVIVTPENFDAARVLVRKEDAKKKGDPAKTKVYYNIAKTPERLEKPEKEDLDKLEITNYEGGIISPAEVNGMRQEINFNSKKWTGNYRPGLKLVEDMSKKTDQEQALLDFYDKVFVAIKAAMGKNKAVCMKPEMAEGTEHFVKYPKKKDDGDFDYTKAPSIWAKPFYTLPEGILVTTARPEDYKINLLIVDEFKQPVKVTDLEKKKFKSYFKLQLFGIENNPNSGGRVLSWRITEMKVKVIGDATEGGYQSTINVGF